MKLHRGTLLLPFLLLSCTPKNHTTSYTVTGRTGLYSVPATEVKILLGTRWEAAAALEDIFGANNVVDTNSGKKVSDITRDQITDQPVSWGGSCDPYAAIHPEPKFVGWGYSVDYPTGYTLPARACRESKTSRESILPGGSTSRMAWTIRACDLFTSATASLQAAVTNAGGSVNTPPTDAQIRSAYDLFHPGAPMPDPVFQALQELVQTASSKYPNSPEAWRFLIFTLCSSPSWQIL